MKKKSESLISTILEETESTNKYLIEQVKRGEARVGTAVLAKHQTAGRGRLGRSFFSPDGGMYLSIALANDSSMTLTSKAAVAVTRTVRQVCHIECGIKWVNDIYLNGKKLCGILAQGAGNMTVVGIGLNYCTKHSDFPEDLKDIVTSLYDGRQANMPSLVDFAETLVANLIVLAENSDDNWLEEYRNQSILTGRNVNVIQAGNIVGSGLVTSIGDDCSLNVMTENGEVALRTGEVSIRFAN